MSIHFRAALLCSALLLAACTPFGLTTRPSAASQYDVIIEHGRLIDGTGAAWYYGDVALRGDRIAAIGLPGAFKSARTTTRVDATGHVVSPGFIDIQAQSYENFMMGDGRAISMVTQGITTAILGEGNTPAPVNARILALETDSATRALVSGFDGVHGFRDWLEYMVLRGASQNIGSFIGNGTVRVYGKGGAMGPATAAELDTMRAVVRNAMEDGAFGIASALIYPPNTYASTEELIEVNRAAAPYGGV
jgi:dihydroorotase/N-acyl-D-amino-acid deacylase